MRGTYFIAISLFLSLLSPNTYAKIGYGVKIGLTAANQFWDYNIPEIDGDIDDKYDYRYGPNAGIFLEFLSFKYFSFVSDFYYAQRGMKAELHQTMLTNNERGYAEKVVNYNNRLDFLGLSLSSKIKYEINQFRPYLYTGLKCEYLTGKKTSVFFDKAYSKYEGNILGIIFGIGTELKEVFPSVIILEGIYNYDITKVEISETLKIRNLSYEIKFGVKL